MTKSRIALLGSAIAGVALLCGAGLANAQDYGPYQEHSYNDPVVGETVIVHPDYDTIYTQQRLGHINGEVNPTEFRGICAAGEFFRSKSATDSDYPGTPGPASAPPRRICAQQLVSVCPSPAVATEAPTAGLCARRHPQRHARRDGKLSLSLRLMSFSFCPSSAMMAEGGQGKMNAADTVGGCGRAWSCEFSRRGAAFKSRPCRRRRVRGVPEFIRWSGWANGTVWRRSWTSTPFCCVIRALRPRSAILCWRWGCRQQSVIDRYVAGEDVPYTELRRVWGDTVGWFPTVTYTS